MKKSIFVVLSLLVIAMFLVGCAPQEELSQDDQQALDSELSQMSDEQLDQVIEEAESQDAGALAGQAYSKYKSIPRAPKQAVLSSAYKAKLAKASCDATGTLLEEETNNFVANGKTTAYPERIRLLAFDPSSKYAYYCKIQFTIRGGRDFNVEEFNDIVSDLATILMPDIMACLPDWEEVTRKDSE